MIRLGGVVGLPAALEGRMIGRVEQTVLSPDGRSLRGLVLRHGLSSARWAGAESIGVLGQVAVVLRDRPTRPPRHSDLLLTSVKDSAGLNLGRVTDVFIHPETLRVTALEVSLGLVEEVCLGRMLARRFVLRPTPEEPGQVLIPCGCVLEPVRQAWKGGV